MTAPAWARSPAAKEPEKPAVAQEQVDAKTSEDVAAVPAINQDDLKKLVETLESETARTEFIGNLKPFMKTPTLGWQLQHVYLILPVAFTLMTIRVIQVNYLKLVKGIDPRDPDKVEVEDMLELVEDERRAFAENEQRNAKEDRK